LNPRRIPPPKKERVTVTLDAGHVRQARRNAKANGIKSFSAYLNQALEAYNMRWNGPSTAALLASLLANLLDWI